MEQNETKIPQNFPKFNCQLCGIKTNNKKDYNKHLITEKHKAKSECNTTVTNFEDNIPKKSPYQYICNKCKKVSNCRVSMWRHKKKCSMVIPISDEDNIKLLNESGIILHDNDNDENIQLDVKANITEFCDKDLIMMLIKQNTDLMEMLKNGTTSHSHNTTNHMNSHNKTFNLQFFLNETCKDAMNINEFIENIKIDVSDLENMGRVGYVEGMSNILIKNLNTLDVSKRPIHCTDKKREIMYIKDNNVWEKDDDNQNKLRRTIKRVSHKNIKILPAYREKYPGCDFAVSRFSDNYNKMIIEVMGGPGDNDVEKENKIIQKVAKHITINKGNNSD
jgi:hypothetical protein